MCAARVGTVGVGQRQDVERSDAASPHGCVVHRRAVYPPSRWIRFHAKSPLCSGGSIGLALTPKHSVLVAGSSLARRATHVLSDGRMSPISPPNGRAAVFHHHASCTWFHSRAVHARNSPQPRAHPADALAIRLQDEHGRAGWLEHASGLLHDSAHEHVPFRLGQSPIIAADLRVRRVTDDSVHVLSGSVRIHSGSPVVHGPGHVVNLPDRGEGSAQQRPCPVARSRCWCRRRARSICSHSRTFSR